MSVWRTQKTRIKTEVKEKMHEIYDIDIKEWEE